MTAENLGNDTTRIVTQGAELVIERIFDAPRSLVWAVFTEREHVPRWWGPHGTRTTVADMDVRPGGRWRYIHHAAPGHDVSFTGEYLEVVPPDKLVRTVVYEIGEYDGRPAVETVTLEDLGGSTKVTSRSRFPAPEVLDQALATGMTQGAIETYDRLAELFAELTTGRS
jgi:uncharacterized protein YndB with AHSA1/START domain